MKKLFFLTLCILALGHIIYSQPTGYNFTIKKELFCTPVKNQASTSTCWSFSGISFLESELMRIWKKVCDLSEMYIVRLTYEEKAERYARMHGTCAFAGGGEYHDVINICREYGLVPEEIYPGLNYGEFSHNHRELDAALKGYMDGVLKNRTLTTAWPAGLDGILDAYLGQIPAEFTWEGSMYTPAGFSKALGINPDEYIILSSFSHHPFYQPFILDVPDNWSAGTCYNLPLDEFMEVIDNAVMTGYSVAWASDVSDKGFSMKEGVAIVPLKGWNEMSEEEAIQVFKGPHPQKVITQELRQREYDNYSTTDDHGMHIVGMAVDQEGNTFYKVKNSWGITGKYDGFIFVSSPYVQLRTTNCMVHKDAIPVKIAKKLGII